MDSSYRPQSPDLSYAPQSPDLSGLQPQTANPPGFQSSYYHQPSHLAAAAAPIGTSAFGGQYHPYAPTSIPSQSQHFPQHSAMPPRAYKAEPDEDEYIPDAPPSSRSKRIKHEARPTDAAWRGKAEGQDDPTLGCQLKTSFPVARIKRIMQADEDIGKVAQVTPTVVSRALELFMIKLISASAHQARGTDQAGGGGGGGGGGKGPRRVLVQHLKRAVIADKNLDFLVDMVARVPDAPVKGKKEANSDSEDARSKKRGKKRKESGDDF